MTARERAAKRIARTIAVLAQGDEEERELADELKSDPEYWLTEVEADIRKHDAKDEKAAAATAAHARIDELLQEEPQAAPPRAQAIAKELAELSFVAGVTADQLAALRAAVKGAAADAATTDPRDALMDALVEQYLRQAGIDAAVVA